MLLLEVASSAVSMGGEVFLIGCAVKFFYAAKTFLALPLLPLLSLPRLLRDWTLLDRFIDDFRLFCCGPPVLLVLLVYTAATACRRLE